jgi:sialic acid synthase SpsE
LGEDFQSEVVIGNRTVGGGNACLVVAEIGPNHDGSPERASALIAAAAEAGCDAVKFQYRRADAELFDRETRSYYYDRPRYDFIRCVQEFPHETHRALRKQAADHGLLYLCSVMSEEAVERVDELNADAIKIPSGEVSNPWLLERAGRTGRPIVASSGMSPQAEIDTMMALLREQTDRVVLLHCVSEYPTPLEDMNLRLIPALHQRYGCPVGISDHSRRIAQVAASVALGSAMIEVHFTHDRNAAGPDHGISLMPEEMASLLGAVRELETALGRPSKVLGAHADDMRGTFTNSIVARRDIRAGETLDRATLALKKPGTGLGPDFLQRILGRRAARDIRADVPISLEDVE